MLSFDPSTFDHQRFDSIENLEYTSTMIQEKHVYIFFSYMWRLYKHDTIKHAVFCHLRLDYIYLRQYFD
jgi:hypothetical protein